MIRPMMIPVMDEPPHESEHDTGVGERAVEEGRAHDDEHAQRHDADDVEQFVGEIDVPACAVHPPRPEDDEPDDDDEEGAGEIAGERRGFVHDEPEGLEEGRAEAEPVGEDEGRFDRDRIGKHGQDRDPHITAPGAGHGLSVHLPFDQRTEDVPDRDVAFLDALRVVGGDDDGDIHEFPRLPAILPEQSDGRHAQRRVPVPGPG